MGKNLIKNNKRKRLVSKSMLLMTTNYESRNNRKKMKQNGINNIALRASKATTLIPIITISQIDRKRRREKIIKVSPC